MSNFKEGDGVHWSEGTDTVAGTVVEVRGASIYVIEDKVRLLNGADSGAQDALSVSVGGFAGHVEGRQRYEFSPGVGNPRRFSRRKTGDFKLAGTSIEGSMRSWGILRPGRQFHRDFNF